MLQAAGTVQWALQRGVTRDMDKRGHPDPGRRLSTSCRPVWVDQPPSICLDLTPVINPAAIWQGPPWVDRRGSILPTRPLGDVDVCRASWSCQGWGRAAQRPKSTRKLPRVRERGGALKAHSPLPPDKMYLPSPQALPFGCNKPPSNSSKFCNIY